jgi:hypothetical protein
MIAKNLNLNVLKKITAVQHGDGISNFINNFYSFKISTKESTRAR